MVKHHWVAEPRHELQLKCGTQPHAITNEAPGRSKQKQLPIEALCDRAVWEPLCNRGANDHFAMGRPPSGHHCGTGNGKPYTSRSSEGYELEEGNQLGIVKFE